jgi:DNA replication and repair protein RecF
MDRLFVDGPGSRRRFLDRLVSNFDPAHLGRVNAYEHAMRERVRLLRTAAADGDWLTTLEDTMATKGVAVAAARIDVICRLSVQLAGETGAFPCATAGVEGAVEGWLAEEPALAAEDRFRDALMSGRAQDATDGRAAIGPHKSNLKVHHLGNGRPAELCSTGEQKALLIALVLGIARLRACEQGAPPLLLLDEVAAHLDDFCRDALFDEISGLGAQVWLTGTDTGLFGGLAGRAQFFNVADGKVTPRDEA